MERLKKIVGPALLLTLLLIAWGLAFAPKSGGFGSTYQQLQNWDSRHYLSIAADGYRIPEDPVITGSEIHGGAANVVFFPGFPLAARGLKFLLGFPAVIALILTAQISCWVFWAYFLLLLRERKISARWSAIATAAVLVHPAAFYLVVGYTEALFMASLLGFLYWCDRWAARGEGRPDGRWYLAAIHGWVMSATRIVSFAAMIYPLLREWEPPRSVRQWGVWLVKRRWAVFLGLASITSAIAFFVYCQWKFGDWALYFHLEEIGWGNHRRWFALLDPLSYVPRFFFEDTVDSFNRLSVPVTVATFVIAFFLERKYGKPESRLSLYAVAFLLFYIPVTGKAAAKMDSMIRYVLPVHIILVVALVEVLSRLDEIRAPPRWVERRWIWVTLGILSLTLEGWFTWRFLHGRWVA